MSDSSASPSIPAEIAATQSPEPGGERKNYWILAGLLTAMVGLLACMLWLIGLLTAETSGAGFVEAERAQNLVPSVREAIREQLTALFGTPDTPSAPAWMPITAPEWRGEIGFMERAEAAENSSRRNLTWRPEEQAPEWTADLQRLQRTPDKKLPGVLLLEPDALLESSTARQAAVAEISPQLLTLPLVWLDLKRIMQSEVELEVEIPEAFQSAVKAGTVLELAPFQRLERGQRLYATQCAMCHGLNGNGKGPQANVLNPKPRDFRQGVFKYTSTVAGAKASRDDLHGTIKNGIAGTGMPAFKLLGNHEIAALADYVRLLAMRGETETQLCLEAEIDFSLAAYEEQVVSRENPQEAEQMRRIWEQQLREFLEQDFAGLTYDVTAAVGREWKRGDQPAQRIQPATPCPEPLSPSMADASRSSVQNGQLLYRSAKLQCADCHGLTGKGDGPQTRQVQKRPDGADYDLPGLHDDWGQLIKPRDLSYGVFHGGRRPEDIYRRIYAGVKGSQMPAYGHQGLSEAEIWDLVNYLYYLAGNLPEVTLEH